MLIFATLDKSSLEAHSLAVLSNRNFRLKLFAQWGFFYTKAISFPPLLSSIIIITLNKRRLMENKPINFVWS